MRPLNQFPSKSILMGCFLLYAVLFLIIPGLGFSKDFKENITVNQTTQARLAVEQAWETYHHAALGGTLSSPMSQTELEMNLHLSRALLASAYDAEDRGDMKTARKLIHQILQITDKVIAESQEPKK